jgi:hypothetical protein
MAESKSPDKAKGRKDRNVRVKERPLASAVGVGARHRRIPNEHVTLNSDVKVTLPSPGIAVNLNNFGSVNSPVLLSANGAKPDIRRSHQYAVKF